MISEKKSMFWLAPIITGLSCLSGILFPPLLLIAVFFAVYYDLRLGNRAQSIVFTVITAGLGFVTFGIYGLAVAFMLSVPVWISVMLFRQEKLTFVDGLIYIIAAILLSAAAAVFAAYAVSGTNPISLLLDSLASTIENEQSGSLVFQSFASQEAVFEWAKDSEGDLAALNTIMEEIRALSPKELSERIIPTYDALIRLYLPTAAVVYLAANTGAVWIFPAFAIKNRKLKNRPYRTSVPEKVFPVSFLRWRFPRLVLILATVAIIVSMFISNSSNSTLVSCFSALEWLSKLLLCIQGAACAALFLQGKRVPLAVRCVIFIAVYGIFDTVLMLIGIADSSFGLRRFIFLRRHQYEMNKIISQFKDQPQAVAEKMRELSLRIEEEEEKANFVLTPRNEPDDQDDSDDSDDEPHDDNEEN